MKRTPACVLALALVTFGCKVQEDAPSSAAPTASAQPPAPVDHVLVAHPPPDGEVATIVRGELTKAQPAGRRLVVYEGATWCEPCQRFHRAVERGELDATFPGLTILEFDSDHDSERLATAGYAPRYLPMFALPAPDGTASGQQVEGGVKGEGAVSVVSGKLRQLLSR
jgi:hypothetical protein